MPKFQQMEVSPEEVASRLRPNPMGAEAFERAANTEREFNQINLRNELHGAEMIGRSIEGAGRTLDEIGKQQKEHDDALQTSAAATLATNVDIGNKYGISGPLGSAGSGMSPAGDSNGFGAAPGGQGDGGVPTGPDGFQPPAAPVDPNRAPELIANGVNQGNERITAARQQLVDRYGENSTAVRHWDTHFGPQLQRGMYEHAYKEQSIASGNALMANVGAQGNMIAGHLVTNPEDLDTYLPRYIQNMHAMMGQFQTLDEAKKGAVEKEIQKTAGTLVHQAIIGDSFSQQGIDRARARLNSGQYDQYIGEHKGDYLDALQAAQNRLYTEAEHQKKAALEVQRGTQANLIDGARKSILETHDWTGDKEKALMLDKSFDGDPQGGEIAAKSLTEFKKASLGQATFVDPALSNRTFTEFSLRMDAKPGDGLQPVTRRDIDKAWAVDHTITYEDRQKAITQLEKQTKGADEEYSKSKSRYFEDMKDSFFEKPPSALTTLGPNGQPMSATEYGKTYPYAQSRRADMQINAARSAMDQLREKATKEGWDWHEIFTPGSPHSFDKQMPGYFTTQQQEGIFRGQQQSHELAKTSFVNDKGQPDAEWETRARAYRNAETGSFEGDYGQKGPVITYHSGAHAGQQDQAYGAYQVMGENVGPWTKKYLGREMTKEEFLNDKQAQDMVFKGRMTDILKTRNGDEQAASRDWFGHGASDGYTSGPGYWDKIKTGLTAQYQHLFHPNYNGVFADGLDKHGEPAAVAPVPNLPAPKHTPYSPGQVSAVTNESYRAINAQGYGARMTGSMTVQGQTFQFETGGRGRGSAPIGDYTIRQYTSGEDRAHMGMHYTRDAFVLSDAKDNAPGTQGQSPRQGLLIHEWAGGQSLGCLEIPSAQWPAFKAAMQKELTQNGVVHLHLGPNGVSMGTAQTSYARPANVPSTYWHDPATGRYWDPVSKKIFSADGAPAQ